MTSDKSNKPYKILVCGSRDYTDQAEIYRVLDIYRARIGHSMLIITGGARGADELARRWAVDNKCDHLVLYAKWQLSPRGAGPIRNRRMAQKRPKLVLAFSRDFDNSRGTRDMIGVAEKMNIRVRKFS